MSHIDFEPGKMVLDFSKGFSLVSLIKVTEQKKEGRKVIFEIGHINSPFKITLGLDNQDNLNLWIKDVKNKNYVIGKIQKKDFFNKWVLLVVGIEKNKDTNFADISLTSIISKDNIITLPKSIEADLGSKTPVQFVIGSNLNHNDNAAFVMDNFSIYETTFTEEEIQTTLVDLLDGESCE